MSTLEVLQNCPSQRKTLLSAIGAIDQDTSNVIMFNLEHFKSRLSHQLAFQIQSVVCGKNVHHTILDEGASTCVMSLACWRSVGSPTLNQSPTTLKEFDGCGFKPYGILSSLTVEVGGKTAYVEVEVVDSPLDYNLLLGRSWFYAMTVVASSVFRTLQFPHQGKIVTIDQLNYCIPDSTTHSVDNVLLVGDSQLSYESVGVGLLKDSTLMGTFPLHAPTLPLRSPRLTLFHPWYTNPLVLRILGSCQLCPSLSHLVTSCHSVPTEAAYHAIQSTSCLIY
jgi:hypothetical protein